jgi:hypothetical protein
VSATIAGVPKPRHIDAPRSTGRYSVRALPVELLHPIVVLAIPVGGGLTTTRIARKVPSGFVGLDGERLVGVVRRLANERETADFLAAVLEVGR